MKTGGKLLIGGSVLGLATWLLWPSSSERATLQVGEDATPEGDSATPEQPASDPAQPSGDGSSGTPPAQGDASSAQARFDRLIARYRSLKAEANAKIPAGTKAADLTMEQKRIVLLLNGVSRQLAKRVKIVKGG